MKPRYQWPRGLRTRELPQTAQAVATQNRSAKVNDKMRSVEPGYPNRAARRAYLQHPSKSVQ